jgi:hypothetical protein
MSHSPEDQAVEKRRKVLKGALVTSGVVTMGYSGSALASLNCMEKGAANVPSGGAQLVQAQPSLSASGPKWAWVPVTIRSYKDAQNKQFEGSEYPTGTVYQVVVPNGNNWIKASSDPVKRKDLVSAVGNGNGRPGWLLVLFDQFGNGYVAAAPDGYAAGMAGAPPATPAQLPQPATESCTTSLNAAVPSGTIYGG